MSYEVCYGSRVNEFAVVVLGGGCLGQMSYAVHCVGSTWVHDHVWVQYVGIDMVFVC